MDTKLKGDIAEQSVILKALRLGFNVLTPIGDRLPFDLVLNKKDFYFKIQVKSAWYDQRKHNYVIDVRRTKTNRREMKRAYYQEEDFDYAIVFIEDLEVFYIIPVSVFNSFGSEIHFVEDENRQRRAKSWPFKEAWELIHD